MIMNNTENLKAETLKKLRSSMAVFVPMSGCTRMPYVICDPQTFDDEILLFFTEEDAKKVAQELKEAGNLMQVVKVDQASLLEFYSSLYPMGVNCILVNKGLEDELAVQLEELIRRLDEDKLPDGKIRVENPELHLTAIYFLQGMRSGKNKEMEEELKALHEEMVTHFKEGRYIVAIQEGKGVPILKQKDGKAYQPVFTDIQEFKKFQNLNKGVVLKTAIIEATKLSETIPPEVEGVVVNPFGVNLQLQMKRA